MALLELLATIDPVSHTDFSGFKCEAVLKKYLYSGNHTFFFPSNLSALE